MELIVLGYSKSGKDTVARALGWHNRKFSQFAKDFVDSIFGGNFEETRNHYVSQGKTKLDLMIELYHLLKPYNASVNYAARHWQLDGMNTVYTDVRTVPEMLFLVDRVSKVLVLPGGTQLSSDNELEDILEVAIDYDLDVLFWHEEHPASYSQTELIHLLAGYGLNSIYRS